MPVIDLDPAPVGSVIDRPEKGFVTPLEDEVTDRPSFGSVVGASFRRENILASASAAGNGISTEDDPDFAPFDHIRGTKYEANWDSFVDVRSKAQFDQVTRQIDREREDRKIVNAAPWYMSVPASLLANVTDPTILVPGGAFVRGARGGLSLARSAASVGAGAGIGTGIQEMGLQGTQHTRTWQEGATDIGASVLLGGLLGAGGAALFNKADWSRAVDTLDRELADATPVADIPAPGSIGAAAVSLPGIADTAVAGRAAGAVAAATQKLNPGLRLAHSEVPEARDAAANLFEMSHYLRGNEDGMASPVAVETLRKEWNAGLMQAVTDTRTAYREFRKGGGKLSRTQFQEEVGRAMRRGDESTIPEVARVAQAWRRNVFDPLKDAAIEAKLLPPDVSVDTAVSYFSRLWNRKRLIAEEGRFKEVVRNWVSDNLPKWSGAYDTETERILNPLRQELAEIEMAKLRRSEELKARQDGGEVEAGAFSEADIRTALRIVEGDAPRPKGVQTLTQFVAAAGGLVDFGGELATRGITNKARPGFVRAQRKRAGESGGGWGLDDMARHAWESGYFPEHPHRISVDTFLNALADDFFKVRAVVRAGDKDAFRLHELIDRLDQDLTRVGVTANDRRGARFSTSEEVKGIVSRVYKALDAEADEQVKRINAKLAEREAARTQEREARFLGDPDELGREISDEVFNTLTGRTSEGVRPEFITVKARGPLKERTFNIPDEMVERWLESDVDLVGRRYQRIMSADVELARKFGSPDMTEVLDKVRGGYDKLRAGVSDEKRLTALAKQEKNDISDLEGVRDLIRGTYAQDSWQNNWGAIVRTANAAQYIFKMGQVVLSSLTEPVRVVAAQGMIPFMRDAFGALKNIDALKLSVKEARLAGNILDKILSARLSTVADLTDFYGSRGPIEKFMDNMTNVASTWNGIRLWTDGVKMLASTMIQNKILRDVSDYTKGDKRYLAYLGIDESMAGRIAKQFEKHGDVMDGVHVAGTAKWDDEVARRAYRAALNKDIDSMVVTRGAADLPLRANTPLGKLLLQFNTFNLASHQRVLLRGLQESHARFLSGAIALTSMGMLQTYLIALATNSVNKLPDREQNPGWWIAEGLDRSGLFAIPFQIANGVEKLTGMNPIKAPLKMYDAGQTLSQKNRNRNELGLLGPTAGTIQDIGTVAGVLKNLKEGEDVSKAQKNAGERLFPYNSYLGIRQMLKYFINPPNE